MKVLIVLVATFSLAACATSGVQQTGRDTYSVSSRAPFSGPARAKGDALKDANAYCTKLGKHIQVVSQNSNECMLHGGCGEAEVVFMCLGEDDPRYSGAR
jgi:hypothetical protein